MPTIRQIKAFTYLLLVDLALLNVAFFGINYIKRGTFLLEPIYVDLLVIFCGLWPAISILNGKYRYNTCKTIRTGAVTLLQSFVIATYCISLLVVMLELHGYSRVHVYGTCLLTYGLEQIFCAAFCVAKGQRGRTAEIQKEGRKKTAQKISWKVFFLDMLMLAISFFAMNFAKRATFELTEEYEFLLLFILALWAGSSFVAGKFYKSNLLNYFQSITACIKAAVIMAATTSVFIYATRVFYFSRTQVYGTFLLLLGLEGIAFFFFKRIKDELNLGRDVLSIEDVQKILKLEDDQKRLDLRDTQTDLPVPVRDVLRSALDFLNPTLFAFIDKHVDLERVTRMATAILSDTDFRSADEMGNSSKRLIINIQKANDIRRINRYFLELHKKLKNGGYFVGKTDTILIHRERFFKRFPKYYAEFFYFFHYLFKRVIPKLKPFNGIYFAITKGRNRTISRAEILGRLCFCGFEIVAEAPEKDGLYFIARKVKTPAVNQNPTFGPLVELKRTGSGGREISVYKFRTMHPYSEYLQEYVYKTSSLQEGGKFSNDFRVTSLGKFMRATWLDELPMLYNWLRGDMKIVGVRPLSRQYLSLYDEELRSLRAKLKPGLIPPFYVDLPETLEEIMASEKRYIYAYLKNPIRTQVVYLYKSFVNIVIKGARSK